MEEDKIVFAPATISWVSEAAITRAEYTEDSMEVYYTYSRSSESGQETTEKKAVLKPNDQAPTDREYRGGRNRVFRRPG